MTEDEAKTKWCPQMYPIAGAEKHSTRCIGSACMAWRWGFDPRPGFVPARSPEEYIAREPHENIGVVQSTINGHCGLAGRPA